jgi:predicted TIM-barrel fold metal-dependent hydrolase
MPWAIGPNAGDQRIDPELRIVGEQIWNRWLADFVSVAPDRLLGVMQQPIWDVQRAVEMVTWGKSHGLKAINFPAPRPDYPTYNQPYYDAFWSVVQDLDLALVCHGGGGVLPFYEGRGSYQLFSSEMTWHSRRGFAQMVFGGVFDRYPRLRVGFTEQRGGWIPLELRNLDSCYLDPQRVFTDNPKKLPSDYWRENCFAGASYMARFEVEDRHAIGVETITWGSDYPHVEGTWPHTMLALRNTFAGIPEDEVRLMIGQNAMRVYGLDESTLRPIADRIGPTPEEINLPLAPDELPEKVGLAFRTVGEWA